MAELELKLPPALIGRAHLARLIRELEVVENDFEHQKAKTSSAKASESKRSGKGLTMPTLSRALHDCVEINDIDLMDGQARMHFKTALGVMKDKAPVMHFTFATDPDGESLQKLTNYVRKEIHPQALISVGLQPALVGGVYLRTPNQVHDFTLRGLLHARKGFIADELDMLIHGRKPAVVATAVTPEPAAEVAKA